MPPRPFMSEQQYPSPRAVVPFEEWLNAKFGGDPPEKAWRHKWNQPPDHFETRPTYAEYVVRTWEDPLGTLVSRFTPQQIGVALWDEHRVFLDVRLPQALRMRAWNALPNLFTQVFGRLGSEVLGHCSERIAETHSLDSACYMWWDIGTYLPDSPLMTQADEDAFSSVCEACLRFSHAGVQESALHGLGHALMCRRAKKRWQALIDQFLENGLARRPELVRYAKQARRGAIQ